MINSLAKVSVLGVPVSAVDFEQAEDGIMAWGHARASRYVVLANVHVVVSASTEPSFGEVVAAADLATPDGAPIAWMLHKLGNVGQGRVSGPDLMWTLLERCALEGLPVYFFGSTPITLKALSECALVAFPKLQIAGRESPPFRSLTAEEDEEVVKRMNASGAGLVFVGLGCPKQEHWMLVHRGRVNAVMLGVGAAFDFHAGTVSRAPLVMRDNGLEWLHRLASEPRRLWKRYLVTNTLFIAMASRQLLAHWSSRIRARF